MQVALSVLLLGAGGLLVRSFVTLHRGPGFDPDRVAIVRLRPSLVGFTNDHAWAYQRDVIKRLEALPGVLAASPAGVPSLPRWTRPVTPVRLPGDSVDSSPAYLVGTTIGRSLGTSRRWASASSRVANSMTATGWRVRASPS